MERFEIQQYGKMQTNVDTKIADESRDVDYEVSLDAWEVGKPEERTEAEVLNRLDELGQGSSIIEQKWVLCGRNRNIVGFDGGCSKVAWH